MNRIGMFLAFFALILTGLVPQGYMAAKAEDGSLAIRICNGNLDNQRKVASTDHGFETFKLLYGDDSDQHDDDLDRSPCPMAMASAVYMPDAVILADVLTERERPLAGKLPLLAGIYPTGLPPSTGPPHS
ncbi:MAG: hypothetical protein WAT93_03230 [Pontixanthobacter sp.]